MASSQPFGTGVYWIGQDGNTYMKASGLNGVVQWQAPLLSPTQAGLTQIADPTVQAQTTAPSNPTGSSAAALPDKSNDIALNNAGLASADAQQTSGLSAIDKALGGLIGQYDTEKATNEGNYGTQSDTNRNNLETNKETALVNATQGRRGLFGTLASLGALNGSGIDLANQAVQKGANADLTGAEGNYAGNQTNLDTAIGTFRQQDAQRRQDANSAATNAKAKVQHDTAVTKQGILTNLASDYAAEGDKNSASKYTQMASDLYPEVANNSIPDTTSLTAENAAFTPGSLANYLSNGSTTVTATPAAGTGGASNLPGLLAANSDQKKKAVTPTPALATA